MLYTIYTDQDHLAEKVPMQSFDTAFLFNCAFKKVSLNWEFSLLGHRKNLFETYFSTLMSTGCTMCAHSLFLLFRHKLLNSCFMWCFAMNKALKTAEFLQKNNFFAWVSLCPAWNTDSFFHGSPLESIWTSGQVHASLWPVSHLSDCVRYIKIHFILLFIPRFSSH